MAVMVATAAMEPAVGEVAVALAIVVKVKVATSVVVDDRALLALARGSAPLCCGTKSRGRQMHASDLDLVHLDYNCLEPRIDTLLEAWARSFHSR